MNCPKGRNKVIVLCNEPTKPPHEDEKNPGVCSRPRAFCLADGEPTPDWKCWQHGGTDYRHEIEDKKFKDCADAAKQFAKDAMEGTATASSGVYIKRPAGQSKSVKNADGSFTYSTVPHYEIDHGKTYVAGVSISWPNMTAAEKAAVETAENALEAHEQGHVTIAEEYLEELNSGATVSATGKDQASAKAALIKKLEDMDAAVGQELNSRQQDYDANTDHGRHQSNIGGVDVMLKCPGK
jgi:hypothetical protein